MNVREKWGLITAVVGFTGAAFALVGLYTVSVDIYDKLAVAPEVQTAPPVAPLLTVVVPPALSKPELPVSDLRAELIAAGVLDGPSKPPKPILPKTPAGPFDPAACPEFRFVEGKDSPSIFPDGHWTPVKDMWKTGISESHECWMRRCRAMGKDDEWCSE